MREQGEEERGGGGKDREGRKVGEMVRWKEIGEDTTSYCESEARPKNVK